MMTIPLSDREIEDLVHDEADHAKHWANGLRSAAVYFVIMALFVLSLVATKAAAIIWGLISLYFIVKAVVSALTWKAR